MTAHRQLALPFPVDPDFSEENFIPAPSNAAAQAWLARVADWPGGRLALFGAAGRGKSHLLQVWARARGAELVAGPGLRGLRIPPHEDAPGGGIAVDDADACAEETALLHLLNAAAEAGLPVLLTGRAPPARWPIRLPDLASRLRAIAAIEILAPEEDLLRIMLARRLSDRQLQVAAPFREYLLARLPRTPAVLEEATCRLDRAALANGGGVTRALVARVVAGMIADLALDEPEARLAPDKPEASAHAAGGAFHGSLRGAISGEIAGKDEIFASHAPAAPGARCLL